MSTVVRGTRAGLIAMLALTAGSAGAQVVRGSVVDAALKTPLRGVDARMLGDLDTLVTGSATSETGTFMFRLAPGRYSLDLRKFGYQQATTKPFRVGVGDTITLTIELARSAITLDTVRTAEKRPVFSTTKGRDMLARHFREGKGIMVAGWVIERSGLSISQYLGGVDGLALTTTQQKDMPAIPAGNGRLLTSAYTSRCLYARVDHVSLAFTLMSKKAESLDDILKVENVMGIEVYRDRTEIPEEWKYAGWVADLYYRRNGGVEYLLGDTGTPSISTTLLQTDSAAFDTRSASRRLLTETRTVMSEVYPDASKGPREKRIPPLPTMDHRIDRDKLVTRENLSIPQCGFLQIWTKGSW